MKLSRNEYHGIKRKQKYSSKPLNTLIKQKKKSRERWSNFFRTQSNKETKPVQNDQDKFNLERQSEVSMDGKNPKNQTRSLSRLKLSPQQGKWLFIFLFLLGLVLMCFPIVSQYLYYEASQVQVEVFNQEVQKVSNEEIERRIQLAHAYNSTIEPSLAGSTDPFSDLQKEGIREYARMLEINEQIGYVSIPKIRQELPVYAGTNENVLQKGVGHIETTSLPVGGPGTHAVITAHRGLPTARLFTDLDQLKKGDIFYYRNIKETLAYQVDKVKVVNPKDIQAIRIEAGEDRMTLLTCTPYMINSHRLLVYGKRIPYHEEVQPEARKESSFFNFRIYFYLALLLLIIMVAIIFIYKTRQKHR